MSQTNADLSRSPAGTSVEEMTSEMGMPARAPNASATDEEIESTRNRALLALSAEAIQSLDVQPVMVAQSMLQHGSTFGRWQTPRKWIPLGQPSLLDVDLRGRVVSFLPESQQALVRSENEVAATMRQTADTSGVIALDHWESAIQRVVTAGVLTLTRYLVLCRMGPAGIGKKAKGRSLDASTIATLAYQTLPHLLAIGLSKRLNSATLSDITFETEGFFRHVVAADLDGLPPGERKRREAELKRMQILSERGCWADVPSFDGSTSEVTSVAGPAEKRQPQQKADPHMPLPDDYVAEMGGSSLWLIRSLAPSLLTIASDIRTIWLNSDDLSVSPARIAQRRDDAVRKLLAEHTWLDSDGRPLSPPPFDIRLSQLGKTRRAEKLADGGAALSTTVGAAVWQPRMLADVVLLLKLVQMAHFFVVGLSMGARKSELVTLTRDCLELSSNGMPYANGRTWKLVDRHDGEDRDWVLPDLAMQAIEQQVHLVTLLDDIGTIAPRRDGVRGGAMSVHLWAEIGGGQADRSKPLMHTQAALLAYAKALGMSPEPGGQTLRVHRFRKTVARLAALALTQAPKVLMDVFGHKSIEMTLYYILNDKDLQVDVERVARELRVMRAKEAVESMVAAEAQRSLPSGGFGGAAAASVSKAIQVHRDRLHRRGEEWGTDSAVELAEILTLQGKAWNLVRPGVICTKFPGTETGPCNQSKGTPEPARCQSHCTHRFEEPFLRADVDGSIRDSVAAYQEAVNRGDELVQALWAAQVRLNLGRFDDLRAKWMQDPAVQSLMGAGVTIEEMTA